MGKGYGCQKGEVYGVKRGKVVVRKLPGRIKDGKRVGLWVGKWGGL